MSGADDSNNCVDTSVRSNTSTAVADGSVLSSAVGDTSVLSSSSGSGMGPTTPMVDDEGYTIKPQEQQSLQSSSDSESGGHFDNDYILYMDTLTHYCMKSFFFLCVFVTYVA